MNTLPTRRMAAIRRLVLKAYKFSTDLRVFPPIREFTVYPPPRVHYEPSVLEDDDMMEELQDTEWCVTFPDGREALLSFTELIVFTYNLLWRKFQIREAMQEGRVAGPTLPEDDIDFEESLDKIMTEHWVRTLLEKMRLETAATGFVA